MRLDLIWWAGTANMASMGSVAIATAHATAAARHRGRHTGRRCVAATFLHEPGTSFYTMSPVSLSGHQCFCNAVCWIHWQEEGGEEEKRDAVFVTRAYAVISKWNKQTLKERR